MRLLLPIALLAVVAAFPAGASTLTPWQTVATSWAPATGTGSVGFNQFDTLGGTLTLLSIEWEFSTYVDGLADYKNNGTQNAIGCFYQFYDTTNVEDGLGNSLGSYVPTYTSGLFAVNVGATVSKGGDSSVEGASGVWNTAPYIAYFSGNGVVTGFSFDATLYEVFGKPDYVTVTDYTNTTYIQGRIRYEYEESQDIPEPGTIALFGLGLLGVGTVIRRRSA
ncbi:MAG: PEP-CTERM sorting domain-containing protein [Armatimonadetes bacterium]|nr:PEP-CTERM sorting domain-containing protein [Armatimonadota bacterium]